MSPLLQTVILAQAFNVITPGPFFFYNLYVCLNLSFKKAIMSAFSIFCATLIISSGSLFINHYIISNFPHFIFIVKFFGGCYIFYKGFVILKNYNKIKKSNSRSSKDSVFFDGMKVVLSNPQVIVFYISLLLQVQSNFSSIQINLLSLYFSCFAFLYYILISSLIFYNKKIKTTLINNIKFVNILAGLAMCYFGIKMIF